MIINKKRIRNLGRYLNTIEQGKEIIISIPVNNLNKKLLESIGFTISLKSGETILPLTKGPISKFNANGKYDIHRDMPKETVYRLAEWTRTEYHGKNNPVEVTNTVEIPYKRYPRTFVEPPSIELNISTDNNGDKLLISPKLRHDVNNEKLILHVINIYLELFGEAHILSSNLDAIIRAPIIKLNWKILPQGEIPWDKLSSTVNSIINKKPKTTRGVILNRIETLSAYEPDFVAVGHGGFWGYLVFGFKKKNLYIMESQDINNATYVLDKSWENISQLSKAEILNNSLHKDRIIHRKTWHFQISKLLS